MRGSWRMSSRRGCGSSNSKTKPRQGGSILSTLDRIFPLHPIASGYGERDAFDLPAAPSLNAIGIRIFRSSILLSGLRFETFFRTGVYAPRKDDMIFRDCNFQRVKALVHVRTIT